MEKQFKEKCIEAFQYSDKLDQIINELNNNNTDKLRHLFDITTDDLQKEINQTIGTGEESIHNARVQQLKLMFECFNELYNIIEINEQHLIPELLRSSRD